MFDVALTSFERKRFANLSHEPNKAMNLNTYIGLLGKRYREREHAAACTSRKPTCRRRSRWRRRAISSRSTPTACCCPTTRCACRASSRRPATSASPSRRRRTAPSPGAAGCSSARPARRPTSSTWSTRASPPPRDLLGRRQRAAAPAALNDIAVVADENGRPVRRYIQDRTVIEDTESTVDLIDKGWRLYNYPERLAYSATPADFGALVVQRGRWANGGLIILPKLLRYLLSGRSACRSCARASSASTT
jgi:hypothetical protein